MGVSKKYIRRPTYDNMDFETFVAGESRIIYSMLCKMTERGRATGRLRVLVLMSHWYAKSRNMALIRTLYEGIMEEIESGEKDWNSDFSGYETMVTAAATPGASNVAGAGGSLNSSTNATKTDEKKKSSNDVFWCKDYQHGKCTQTPPHMAQIKPDEMPVPVMHICAACWQHGRRRKEHPESDCITPAKK